MHTEQRSAAQHTQTQTHKHTAGRVGGYYPSLFTLSLFKHEPAAVLRDGAVNEGLLAKQTNRDEQIGDEWRGGGDDSQVSKTRHNQISQDDAGLRPPLSSLHPFSTLLRCSTPSFLSPFLCPFSSIFYTQTSVNLHRSVLSDLFFLQYLINSFPLSSPPVPFSSAFKLSCLHCNLMANVSVFTEHYKDTCTALSSKHFDWTRAIS